jgi:hypothetical protein
MKPPQPAYRPLFTVVILFAIALCLYSCNKAHAQEVNTNTMPDIASVEALLTNSPASFVDKIGVDIGVFVNTRAAQPKHCIVAGMITYSTGPNTFLGLGAFGGESIKGGAAAVGGLKCDGSIHIPLVNYTLRTSQWVADGLCYVSGQSGTQAYGYTLPRRDGWENYFVATVVAHVSDHVSVGISSLIIGPDVYLGGGVGVTF